MQLGNLLRLILDNGIVEVVHIHHTEHVFADIENQHRVESRRKLPERRFLRNVTQ